MGVPSLQASSPDLPAKGFAVFGVFRTLCRQMRGGSKQGDCEEKRYSGSRCVASPHITDQNTSQDRPPSAARDIGKYNLAVCPRGKVQVHVSF